MGSLENPQEQLLSSRGRSFVLWDTLFFILKYSRVHKLMDVRDIALLSQPTANNSITDKGKLVDKIIEHQRSDPFMENNESTPTQDNCSPIEDAKFSCHNLKT